MRRANECLPCVLDDLLGALSLLDLDERVAGDVLAEALDFLDRSFAEPRTPSYYITGVHRILKRVTGIEVPFAELREACNLVGAEIAAEVGAELRALPRAERFRFLCLWAVAGNHLDFRTVGAGYGFGKDEIRGMLEEKVEEGFEVDEVDRIEGILDAADRIVYVPDNVGEIAFDRLLVRHLREGGAHLTVPYRAGPITSDATLHDFRAVGLDETADEILCAGPDTLGVSFEEMTPELRRSIERADAILAKGQANFYAFHEERERIAAPVACLLTTKCDVVSGVLRRKGKINVATVLSPGAAR